MEKGKDWDWEAAGGSGPAAQILSSLFRISMLLSSLVPAKEQIIPPLPPRPSHLLPSPRWLQHMPFGFSCIGGGRGRRIGLRPKLPELTES